MEGAWMQPLVDPRSGRVYYTDLRTGQLYYVEDTTGQTRWAPAEAYLALGLRPPPEFRPQWVDAQPGFGEQQAGTLVGPARPASARWRRASKVVAIGAGAFVALLMVIGLLAPSPGEVTVDAAPRPSSAPFMSTTPSTTTSLMTKPSQTVMSPSPTVAAKVTATGAKSSTTARSTIGALASVPPTSARTTSTSRPATPRTVTTKPSTAAPTKARQPAPRTSTATTGSGSDPGSGCVIKGNIASDGERIYHVPGQQFYDKTKISPEKGERWFCTEAEAVGAGWRKAKV